MEDQIEGQVAEVAAHREVEDALKEGGLSREELEAKFAQLEHGGGAGGAARQVGDPRDRRRAGRRSRRRSASAEARRRCPSAIVVSFRGSMAARCRGAARATWSGRSRTKKRAEAHGATLCAWSALTFSFGFETDELEEAMRLASLASTEPSGFGVGVAEGELSAVGERGSLAGLAWGLPLVTAAALSRAARRREVLIDRDARAARAGEIEAARLPRRGRAHQAPRPAPGVRGPPPA